MSIQPQVKINKMTIVSQIKIIPKIIPKIKMKLQIKINQVLKKSNKKTMVPQIMITPKRTMKAKMKLQMIKVTLTLMIIKTRSKIKIQKSKKINKDVEPKLSLTVLPKEKTQKIKTQLKRTVSLD
jgi:hypothetical protein